MRGLCDNPEHSTQSLHHFLHAWVAAPSTDRTDRTHPQTLTGPLGCWNKDGESKTGIWEAAQAEAPSREGEKYPGTRASWTCWLCLASPPNPWTPVNLGTGLAGYDPAWPPLQPLDPGGLGYRGKLGMLTLPGLSGLIVTQAWGFPRLPA